MRLTQQQKNTIEVINYLEAHPAVKRGLYAGSYSEYEAQVNVRQANGLARSSPMELVDGADLPPFLEALKISLRGEPGRYRVADGSPCAHGAGCLLTQAHRDEYGVSDNLIRLAIGIERLRTLSRI